MGREKEKKVVQTRSLGRPLCEDGRGNSSERGSGGEQCLTRAVSGDVLDVTAEVRVPLSPCG